MSKIKPTIKRCPTCGRREKRTSDQNARLWAIYAKMSSKLKPGGRMYTPDQYHDFFKMKILGAVEQKLPNGKTIVIPNSSADLSVDEFSDFLGRVEAEAAEHDCYLDD